MTELTSPDNIAKWTVQDPTSLVQESQTQGDSIQAAFNKRQRFDYVWPTAAERTAQTGMVQSSRGYQVDTKTEYLYDNSQWRLAVPYAEFSFAAKSIPNNVYTQISAGAIDTPKSTSTTFVTLSGADGVFTLVDPGVYGFSIYAEESTGGAITGQSHAVVSTTAAGLGTQYTRGYFTGGQSAMVAMPFLYTSSSNTTLYISVFQNTGAAKSIQARLRIGRFG